RYALSKLGDDDRIARLSRAAIIGTQSLHAGRALSWSCDPWKCWFGSIYQRRAVEYQWSPAGWGRCAQLYDKRYLVHGSIGSGRGGQGPVEFLLVRVWPGRR